MTTTLDGTNGITYPDASTQGTAGYTGFRNRIINGDMRIDQRNAGASVSATNSNPSYYTLDRWAAYSSPISKYTVQQNAGSVTLPAGFNNYIGCTSSSSYAVTASDLMTVFQRIEGYNMSYFAYGTANARTTTLSFYVYSSITGTWSGSVQNSAQTRAYNFIYTISAANTWTYVTMVIPGDTTGTWLTTNGVGLGLYFNLGSGSTYTGSAGSWFGTSGGANAFGVTGTNSLVGTNGATWYLTGVQLELGGVATPFERRQYGTELGLCQRYCCNVSVGAGVAVSTTSVQLSMQYPVTMRAGPSSITAPQGTVRITDSIASDFTTAAPAPGINNGDQNGTRITINGFTGLTSGRFVMMLQSGASAAPVQFSAEL